MTVSTLTRTETPAATAATPATATAATDSFLSSQARRELLAGFHRDGFARLPGLLAAQAPLLRACIDRAFDEHPVGVGDNRYDDIVMTRLFELDPVFQSLLTAEPFISIAEDLLGEQCHLIAQNCVRNPPCRAISFFHVDDSVQMALPPEIPRHDPRVHLPIFLFTFQILLTDVPDDTFGPTQFVPGSHYSGREPNDRQHPTWEGQGPVSIHGKAGDVYLHNGQCWHRGAANTSVRTRYLLQIAIGQRWVSQRFYPFIDYRLPDHVRARADERCMRVLGQHPRGAYG